MFPYMTTNMLLYIPISISYCRTKRVRGIATKEKWSDCSVSLKYVWLISSIIIRFLDLKCTFIYLYLLLELPIQDKWSIGLCLGHTAGVSLAACVSLLRYLTLSHIRKMSVTRESPSVSIIHIIRFNSW